MKKIIVFEVPDNITEVSIAYSNLLGTRYVGHVKCHPLPQPKDTGSKDLLEESIQMCQNAGWNACIDAIRNLS